jgi:thiol-disulfide isomerase/thioredoxin
MKKVLSISLALALFAGFTACKKNNSNTSGTNPVWTAPVVTEPVASNPLKDVGPVPTSFVKKVVVEEFTGEWCGACPSGAADLHDIVTTYPDKAYAVAIHNANGGSDPYEVSFFDQLNAMLGQHTSYPGANIDRVKSSGSWKSEVDARLKTSVNMGMALVSKTSGDNVNLDIYFGQTTTITKDLKYTIYLIENNLPQSAQGQTSAGAGYIHEHVFRNYLNTNMQGDDFTWTGGQKYTKLSLKNLSITGQYKDKNNLKLLVLVHTPGKVGDAGVEIVNAQECGLNEIKKWN